MDFSLQRTIHLSACLLLALALTQAAYTALYVAEMTVPRQLLWGLECLLFTLLTAFAGAAALQSNNLQVGWAAIAFSAVLNVVQVSIGLAMFGPFREAAGELEALKPAAGAVVALSFMIYYAAKMLLGLAALVFGTATLQSGSRALGGLTAAAGGIALFANAVLIAFGRDAFLPSAVAGGSGVVATLLLAVCLFSVARKA